MKLACNNLGYSLETAAPMGARLHEVPGALECVNECHAAVSLNIWFCCCSENIVSVVLDAGREMRRWRLSASWKRHAGLSDVSYLTCIAFGLLCTTGADDRNV